MRRVHSLSRTAPRTLAHALAAGCLSATLSFVAPGAAVAAQCAPSAPDAATALAAAATCAAPVEIESHRTELQRVFATPSGSGIVEVAAFPQRVRGAGGQWSTLDPTLRVNPEGTWSPRAAAVELVLSGGGAGPAITMRHHGKEAALRWPAPLPRPAIDGPAATYRDVLPGVDLVITALDTGFSEVLVVKERAAARNPALRRLVLGSQLEGLHWEAGAGLRAVDAAGQTVLAASAPMMWDSSQAGGHALGPAHGARTAPISLSLAGTDLILRPDPRLLEDPDAVFPLYLDPTIVYTAWTMINSTSPNQSYWSYDKTDCPIDPATGREYATECAKVGYYSPVMYRSMWGFPTSGFQGKQILGARFTIDLLHSASCSNSTTELRRVGTISSTTTWNNNASTWSASNTATVSNSSCNSSRRLTELSGTLATQLQAVADGTAAFTYWGLKALNESSSAGWKKFDAKTAKLVVEVNTVPAAPVSLTADGKSCATGAARPAVATVTPSLRAQLNDAEGQTLTGSFEYTRILADGSYDPQITTRSQAGVPSGGTALVGLSPLVGDRYAYRAYATDPYITGPTSAWCEFEVDTVPPAVPAVTSDVYLEGLTACAGGPCGSVGQTGRFTFSSSSDTQSYRWGWSDPPSNVLIPATLGGSVFLDWTPAVPGPATLHVRAVDRAGNESAKAYLLSVATPSPALARWRLNDAPGSAMLADDTGHGWTAALSGATPGVPGRIAPGNDGLSWTAVRFDGADDYAATAASGPVLNTGKSFTVTAWVKAGSTAASMAVLSQGGVSNPALRLGYDRDTNRWAFAMSHADTGSGLSQAISTLVPRVGVWTHLAGVYDSGAKRMTLYVNGIAQQSADYTGTEWSGTQALQMGRAIQGGAWSRWWNGSIAEAQVWNRVVSAAELAEMTDPIRVGAVGRWDMEDVGPGPTYDGSGLAHDFDFYPQPGGPQIPPTGTGHSGAALTMDGVDDYARTNEPVVYTDQSFTVSAWVNLSPTVTGNQVAVSQHGTVESGFYLKYEHSDGYWYLVYGDADGTTGTGTLVRSLSPAVKGSWVHLTGVYDAQAGTIRFYVGTALQGTAAVSTPWHASGPLSLGRVLWRGILIDYWTGSIDEVRVYQGAINDPSSIS